MGNVWGIILICSCFRASHARRTFDLNGGNGMVHAKRTTITSTHREQACANAFASVRNNARSVCWQRQLPNSHVVCPHSVGANILSGPNHLYPIVPYTAYSYTMWTTASVAEIISAMQFHSLAFIGTSKN